MHGAGALFKCPYTHGGGRKRKSLVIWKIWAKVSIKIKKNLVELGYTTLKKPKTKKNKKKTRVFLFLFFNNKFQICEVGGLAIIHKRT